jgi:SAM-dependent methyltransferase
VIPFPAASADPAPPGLTFVRYLAAKRTVDDRALNRTVYDRLVAALGEMERPEIAVLEIGCGSGVMLARLAEWQPFPAGRTVRYLGIDSDATAVAAATARALPAAGLWQDWSIAEQDLYGFAAAPERAGTFDLVIANAVLDLLDLAHALPALRRLLRPGGLGWFTINFDGMTRLLPVMDPEFDHAVEAAYHATMDTRLIDGQPSGDSRTGSRLFTALPAAGFHLLAAGPSDWVVFPGLSGYAADEADFLRFIVQTMHGALRGHAALDPSAFDGWVAERYRQIDACQLVYLAHQFDFLVQRPLEDQP